MSGFVIKFRTGRFIWTVLVTAYFLIFFTNFFSDAAPGRSLIQLLFAYLFVLWLAVEYYFGSPFFQTGVVEPHGFGRTLFAFFVYPFLGYLGADYIWWHFTQIPLPPAIAGIIGLLLFAAGVYLRLATLFALLGIVQIKSGGAELLIPSKKFLALNWQQRCRHPRYLATLIQLCGAALVFNSWGGLVLVLVIGLPLIWFQLRYEERVLSQQMKPEYDCYRQTVPLLIPRPKRSRD
jgi:protein-S-isoprenylcysteine O-methyltransferase Ste14